MPEKMMEGFERWLIRFLKFIVTGVLLVAYLLLVGQWITPEPQRSITRFSDSKRHLKAGVSAGVVKDGEHYFYRNGKKYKL